MAASSSRKRKIGEEKRVFQERWTEMYFFIAVKQVPVCLICNESVSVMKEFNLKRHYETKHALKMDKFQGEHQVEKLNDLKEKLRNQQSVFLKQSAENEMCVKASYIVAEKIAKNSKPFSNVEFVKECMEAVIETVAPAQSKIISQICLSRNTITRRIEEISGNIENILKERAADFVYCSVALDESTDISDTAQLAVFIRGVSKSFEVTEELAGIYPIKGTTKGVDVFNALKSVLNNLGVDLKKVAGAVTDGAPAMIGKHEGAIAHLRKQTGISDRFMQYHCIVHQENLCAKNVWFKEVMKDVIKIVNFIRSHALNHREFQELLSEMDAEYCDVLYHTEIRWLSRGKVLKRIYDLKTEIGEFMKLKGKPVHQFNDAKWMADFSFLLDISTHLNNLNVQLQGKNKLDHNLFGHIKAFEHKLALWETQLKDKNVSHFHTMALCKISNVTKYVDAVAALKTEFSNRFADFKANEQLFRIFSTPFSVDAGSAPSNLQMELIELQCDTELKERFDDNELLVFYAKFISTERFPELNNHAIFVSSLFGSTYICEQIFSMMKNVKSKARNKLTDAHLENSLRIASSAIKADIDKLAADKYKERTN